MKGFHYYNIGGVFEAIYEIIKPLMSKKFKERVSKYIVSAEVKRRFDKNVFTPRRNTHLDGSFWYTGSFELLMHGGS